ncbi:MAG: SEC-C metal-binding domain-containing protein [Bacillota bacterium]
MSLYSIWMDHAFSQEGHSVDALWDVFLPKEQKIYEFLIGQNQTTLEGTILELAEKFSMSSEEFVGFLDGINESLEERFQMDSLEETTKIKLVVDFERLYKKMVEYKADHLMNLKEWDVVFDDTRRKQFTLEQKKSRTIINPKKIGRNDPCTCGSGKKYKRCCGGNA